MPEDLLTNEQEKSIEIHEIRSAHILEEKEIGAVYHEYKNIGFYVTFDCYCYEDPDAFCGNSFYFKYDGTVFSGNYVHWDEDTVIEEAKETIDKFLEEIAKRDDNDMETVDR